MRVIMLNLVIITTIISFIGCIPESKVKAITDCGDNETLIDGKCSSEDSRKSLFENCDNVLHEESISRVMYKTTITSEILNCMSEIQVSTCNNGVMSDYSGSYTDARCLSDPTISTTTSITQHGITWIFSKPVAYGKFATGDYYVIGPVTILSISPMANNNGRNGSQVNPHLNQPSQPLDQPFDSRAYYYSTKNLFTSGILNVGDSLVSTISKDGSEINNWAGGSLSSHAMLRTSAILTVLDSHPLSLSFRPTYINTTKTIHSVSSLNLSILNNLSLDNINLPNHNNFKTVEYYLRGLERPWTFLHGSDWTSRSLVPEMNSEDYHEQAGRFLSEVSVLLNSDWSKLDETDKTQLIYRFVQLGIDYYGAVSAVGTETSYVWAWPIVFTGLLLNDPEIYNFWINNPDKRTQRGHEKLYYIGDRNESIASLIVPKGTTWVGWKTASGRYPAFAKQNGEEYEHLHPSEWLCYSPHCKSEVYRAQHDIYPLIGMTLASIIIDKNFNLDVNSMLAHDPIRDYCDRWMNLGFMTNKYKNTERTYLEEMRIYQTFTIYNYQYGSGGSSFVDDMWAAYRNKE